MNKLIVLLILLSPSLALPATYYVTPAGAGGQSGADWTNAFALTDFETYVEATPTAGDIFYFKGGVEYTSSSDIVTAADGTDADPIRIVGVVGESTTPATGSDRPTITSGAYDWQFDNFWTFENLIGTIETSLGFTADNGTKVINCKFTNNSGTAGRRAIWSNGLGCLIKDTEAISTNGVAIAISNHAILIHNYVHDSDTGIYSGSDDNLILENIIDTCTTVGINLNSQSYIEVIRNTIYNCGVGISGGTASPLIFVNSNIIDTCTTGASWSATALSTVVFDYNNWHNNTGDVSNVSKGSNATASDPSFTNAAGGDFSLGGSSPCLDAAEVTALGIQ